jgi:oligoribonuclease NrnB/cAMP/cGMP phosphodiesterase (DHH superfamily)
MKCFYHSADLDGHCSGAIVNKFYEGVDLRPIDYGQPFPWGDITEGETVFMVDFALQPFSDMLKLSKMCKLVWIDHHVSALKAYVEVWEEHGDIEGLRDAKVGACELTWRQFYPDTPMPDAVRFLGMYDSWRHGDDDECLDFQYGMRVLDTDPKIGKHRSSWDMLLSNNNSMSGIRAAGCHARVYQKQQDAQYLKAASFETNFANLRCIAVNKLLTSSQLFASVWDPDKYDAMLTFGWKNGSWTVSLYSTKEDVDVSVIAKAHGGGGHKSASGFQCTTLPFAPFI